MSKEVSHTALYRKYRPAAFADVQGQGHIVDVLENSIASGRIAHAYLFAGSRGTGKTSIARIFARALGTSDNDIYEIDAASNRGIDDIRAIRDAVAVLPLESQYKVYIVDEVHMLTKEAFNALLKTLEEPPKHVIFILATTELEKLPETVVSRCQVFAFKKPSRDVLRGVVTSVAKKEGVVLEPGAAELVALLGDGSFRDTLGTLQKVLSSVGEGKNEKKSGSKISQSISLADVEAVTGAPKNSLVNDFLSALTHGDAAAALSAVALAEKSGVDMKFFVALILEKARIILLLKISKENTSRDIAELLSAEDAVFLEKLAALPAPESRLNASALAHLLRAYDETARAYISTLPLELAVVEITKEK